MNFPSILESISDLNLGQVEYLLNSAKGFKYNPRKHPYYEVNPPVVATCFLEHSTRTRNSFVLAAEKLGAIYLNFDPATSSLKKGENLEANIVAPICFSRKALPCEARGLIYVSSGQRCLESYILLKTTLPLKSSMVAMVCTSIPPKRSWIYLP